MLAPLLFLGCSFFIIAASVGSIYALGVQRDIVTLSIDRDLKTQIEMPLAYVTATHREEVHETTAPSSDSNDSNMPDIEYIAGIDSNLLRQIDFQRLQAINSDAYTWLCIPDTNIDYYVLQEQVVNRYYYIWRDIYKNNSTWGSLFSPKQPVEDTPDAHQIIFGHRMQNRNVAFSSLASFADKHFADRHRYAYLYYPDRVERWVVWASANVAETDMIYTIPYVLGSTEYDSLLNHIEQNAILTRFDRPSANTNTLVLSTCHNNDTRFVVVYVPDRTYYY